MLASFRSKKLSRFWEDNDASGVKPEWRRKVLVILSRMDASTEPQHMNVPGFGFHALSGDMKGRYAVTVSRNWRITFAWDGKDAIDVDLEDYHGR